MTYNSGTATDYIDMLDQLIEIVTGRHMATVVVNAGGTGHAIGDIIDIDATGSTSTELAKIEVVTVSGGVITAVRVYRGGVYTVDPTTTTANAQSATTGAGINSTFDLTFAATGWTQNARESEAVAAVPTVAAGGTGYSVSDVLTLVGGVLAPGGAAATYTVATLSGSAVATVTTTTQGDYEVFPTNAVLTSVAPAGGTGCTLTVAWQDLTGDTIVVLQGDAGASIDPLVGIKTYSSETDESSTNTVFNWLLCSFPSWDSGTNLHLQANLSPGFSSLDNGDVTTSTTGDGSFMPLKDSTAFNIEWWCSATGRRVHLICKVETASTVYYSHCSFGLLNQFGVTSELPWPGYVVGSSDRKRCYYADTTPIWGGISQVISRLNGPLFVWAPEGAWVQCRNSGISSNTTSTPTFSEGNTAPRCQLWPIGETNERPAGDDLIWSIASSVGFDNDDLTLTVSPLQVYRTPDTGGDLFPLFPLVSIQANSSGDLFRTFGEIDGVWWFSVADSGASSEDRFEQGSVAYSVFQNGTEIENFSYLALRED